ncbi:DUF2690 domain-containing protein [Streptomyces sp. NPDC046197]|uniref:helix-turn-helix domain-containing protein n=1 Tax=Streptomyces sp. NPDC046197 TaxID=3154337 RepID=UPI0033E398A7
MPRWKALPDELDPQVREFAGQLRRLVDRSGLSIAALADRTGYSKTSWERYLNGRLLAPKGAIVALAEVTETNPVHLTTMWELAERAWSRAEMRHDRTMEAIRIAQARAALGDFGAAAPAVDAQGGSTTAAPGGAGRAGVAPTVPSQPTASDADAREGASKTPSPASGTREGASKTPSPASGTRKGASKTPLPASEPTSAASDTASPASGTASSDSGDASSAASSASRTASSASGTASPDSDAAPSDGTASSASGGGSPAPGSESSAGRNSWGLAGYRGPSPVGGRASGASTGPSDGSARTPAAGPSPYGEVPEVPEIPKVPEVPQVREVPEARQVPEVPQAPRPARANGDGARYRPVVMFLAGMVSMLVVIGVVFFFTDRNGGGKAEGAARSPSPSASAGPDLPPGVKCSGAGCTGKDAESMGCSGQLVSTAQSVTVGTTVVEVRYSKTCGAAWGRITQAGQGDAVQVAAGAHKETGTITAAGDTIAYTPMVAVRDGAQAKACVTLASGRKGCTR